MLYKQFLLGIQLFLAIYDQGGGGGAIKAKPPHL